MQTVRIRAYGDEVYYLRDLPLHPSMKEVETAAEWSDFEMQLRPSSDFLTQLLSRGALIKVIEPQWLANEIKRQHIEAAERYK